MTDASLKRRRLWHDTRGFTAVFLALTLSVLIGFSALGVETGLWYLIKRVNQSRCRRAVGRDGGRCRKAISN
jgi:Flp pilus assembly protein TadG